MFSINKAFSGFSVDDLQRAKAFYTATLGIKVVENAMGILELHFENGNYVIVYPKPDHLPATFTVLNFPVININAAVDDLVAKKVRFERYEGSIKTDERGICRNGDHSIAWFKDPAGNIFSIIEETVPFK